MAVRPILHYGNPILREKCKPVIDFQSLAAILEDMYDSMYEADGIGLAANQIGFDLHCFVIDVTHTEEADEPIVFVNSKLIASRGASDYEEGCLSLPGIQLNISRPEFVTIEYQDESGKTFSREFGGLLARAIQHEMDHLNGVMIVDRVSELARMKYQQELKAFVNETRQKPKPDLKGINL
ncbi:MAG: peptide deformylase [FCB group bacterium]|nr:peptide deformylase [FCB group bacterium]